MLANQVIKATYTPSVNLYHKGADEAYKLIQNAQSYAVSLIQEARSKASKQIKKARKRSQRLGFKAGQAEANLAFLERISKQMQTIDKYLADLKADCFKVTLEIVENVLQTEMQYSSQSLYERLEKVLSSVTDRHDLRIFINPLDFERLKKLDATLTPFLVKNEQIKVGNAILNSPIGRSEINWQEHLTLLTQIVQSRLQN